ncbi:MAG: CRTAC1 family protein [Candidatus Solibacter usitatus]|nr:CRTAC1 family protein [Candidatus Solibacter usitatus]
MRVALAAVVVLASLLIQAPDAVRFVDVAAEAGIKDLFYCGAERTKNYIVETLGAGVAFIDYDNDGRLDLFVVTASRLEGFPRGQEPTNHLYRNEGGGKFKDVSREAGVARSGWGQGVCAGDFDNDGYIDLFVTYWGHDVLYRNTGKGGFEDVTEAAGLSDKDVRWGTGCAFVDYNRDGKLDLFVANYVQFDQKNTPVPGMPNACTWKGMPVMCGPRGLKGGINRLWRNDSVPGRIKFTDVSGSSGITAPGERYSLSVTTLDYDHDGWPDLYVAVDSQASILYHNNRDGSFTDTGVEAGVAYSEDGREQAGMGTSAADYDGDGLLDLAKTNFTDDAPNIYRNNGDGSFTEAAAATGLGSVTRFLGWGAVFIDYDNDTWPDLFLVNGHVYPNAKDAAFDQRRLLFRNLAGRRFQDVSLQSGDGVSAEHSGRGLAAGDYDNDGDVDLAIMNMNQPPSLLRNEGGNRNRFLNLRLVGTKSNRSAIGARVVVTVGGRTLVNEVRSGSSFMSHSDLRMHFGLGQSQTVDRVEIEWPSGAKETVPGVKANIFITVTEGKGISR